MRQATIADNYVLRKWNGVCCRTPTWQTALPCMAVTYGINQRSRGNTRESVKATTETLFMYWLNLVSQIKRGI